MIVPASYNFTLRTVELKVRKVSQ